jgi:lipopolysaccharide/colanic/teichoic acid biosynthesis glycosyltransferase
MIRRTNLEPIVSRNAQIHALSAVPAALPRKQPAPRFEPQVDLPPGLSESRIRYVVQAVLAIAALLVLSPLLLIVAAAVKLSSPGPLFYAGVRVGKNQRLYTMYKFRTLRDGSERQIGGRLLSPQDDFYTPVGKFLKRSKLDEIPQLWNVLRGEMNFVGPRPVRPIFLQRFLSEIPTYANRFRVAPGMTGLAQVRGGYFTSPANKLRYDSLYIAHRSLWLDTELLALTALKLLNRWLTLGVFLLLLLLFVSFIPATAMEHLYVTVGGLRVNPLHGAIAFAALWMVLRRVPTDRISVYRTPLNLPIACFLLLALASAAQSVSHVQAVRGAAYYLITGFIVLLAIVNGTFTRTFVRRAVTAVALTSVAISAIGILKLVLAGYLPQAAGAHPALGTSDVAMSSTLGSPVALATYLILGIPCLLCKLSRAHTRQTRDFWVAASTLTLIGVLLTKHPAGLLAVALTATLYLWHGFGAMSAAVFASLLSPFAYLSLRQVLAQGELSWLSLLCGGSTDACRMVLQLPTRQLLFGIGPRTLGELADHAPLRDAAAGANGHVSLLLENGILGWAAMLWILGTALVCLYRAQRDTTDPALRAVLWAVFASLVGFCVTIQSFNPFDNISIQLLFWGLVGIGIGTQVRLGERPSDYRVAFKLGH